MTRTFNTQHATLNPQRTTERHVERCRLSVERLPAYGNRARGQDTGIARRLGSLCSLRSLWLVSSRSRANQSVEATATRALALMAGTGDLGGVCGRRASP